MPAPHTRAKTRAGAFLGLASVLLILSCHRDPPRIGSGDEWLSWSRAQKETYVIAYIDGHAVGQQRICQNLDQQGWLLKPTTNFNSNVSEPCQALKTDYSHIDPKFFGHNEAVDPYVAVIDDFYKHPECRVMPFVVLLENLNDEQFKSGDELYKYVQTDAEWGAFSGFDGMDKCYGVHAKWRMQPVKR